MHRAQQAKCALQIFSYYSETKTSINLIVWLQHRIVAFIHCYCWPVYKLNQRQHAGTQHTVQREYSGCLGGTTKYTYIGEIRSWKRSLLKMLQKRVCTCLRWQMSLCHSSVYYLIIVKRVCDWCMRLLVFWLPIAIMQADNAGWHECVVTHEMYLSKVHHKPLSHISPAEMSIGKEKQETKRRMHCSICDYSSLEDPHTEWNVSIFQNIA